MASTNDLKNGMTLNLEGQLWNVVEFQHVKPGKGPAFVRTKLKNVMSGKVVDKTFNAGIKVDVANVDKRDMQYLYREGDDFVFMDLSDYDQPRIPAAVVGDAANYLLEEQTVTIAFNDGTPLYVDMPAAVELVIAQTDPGLQGDRSTGGTKPATLETGATIAVPLFITTGEKVKVDTRGAISAAPDSSVQMRGEGFLAARSKARKRALDILFEAELRGLPTLELLSERQSVGEVPVQPYAAELVRGVATHSERIDELISWNLVDWTLERMPAVDRNVLRHRRLRAAVGGRRAGRRGDQRGRRAGAGPVDGQLAAVRERRPGPDQGRQAGPVPRSRPVRTRASAGADDGEDPYGDDDDDIDPYADDDEAGR